MAGIEPAWPAWKAGTLPLSYTRVCRKKNIPHALIVVGRSRGRNRFIRVSTWNFGWGNSILNDSMLI